jgi:hypothetical protein
VNVVDFVLFYSFDLFVLYITSLIEEKAQFCVERFPATSDAPQECYQVPVATDGEVHRVCFICCADGSFRYRRPQRSSYDPNVVPGSNASSIGGAGHC